MKKVKILLVFFAMFMIYNIASADKVNPPTHRLLLTIYPPGSCYGTAEVWFYFQNGTSYASKAIDVSEEPRVVMSSDPWMGTLLYVKIKIQMNDGKMYNYTSPGILHEWEIYPGYFSSGGVCEPNLPDQSILN